MRHLRDCSFRSVSYTHLDVYKRQIPDITLTSGNRALNYYPNIPNVDVTELVDEINEKRPYFDSVYEGAKYGGVNYFVPFTSSTCLMFVRTDMLEAKGITKYPETWDEVFEVAEKVADPDKMCIRDSSENRIERAENVKEVEQYISRVGEMMERKERLMGI